MSFIVILYAMLFYMARDKNSIQTAEVRISTTPIMVKYLQQLVDTGLYGKTKAEAAERLLSDEVKKLLQDGTLKRNG